MPNTPIAKNILEAALKYVHNHNFSVIPLKGKIAAIEWKEFQKRRPTDEELINWFSGDKYNIGIVTGEISGLTVFDYDSQEIFVEDIQSGSTPKTGPIVQTGKGFHVYCKYAQGTRNFQTPGLDLRSEGGYVVAPPSIHESGKVYKWLRDLNCATLPDCPAWKGKSPQSKPDIQSSQTDIFSPKDEGGRNDSLFRAGCDLQRRGFSGTELYNLLSAINGSYNPPLDDKEFKSTFHSIQNYKPEEAEKRKLVVVTHTQMQGMQISKPEMILSPWLCTQSLTMIYSWRGTGKTWMALNIAYAVATGGKFLKWEAICPQIVLYIDGEMPAYAVQDRLDKIRMSTDSELPTDNLQIFTPDFQPSGIPDLSTKAGQEEFDSIIRPDIKLVIIDNISALCRSGKENESEGWVPVQEWALRMRTKGISVLFIHHAGKGGNQRGSSKREDLLDTVIKLDRPTDYRSDQGARFEVHFEKARHIFSDETTPFIAQLETDPTGKAVWTVKDLEGSTYEKVIELATLGMKQAEIAIEIGINKSTVSRHYKKAVEEGRLTEKGSKQKLQVASPIECNYATNNRDYEAAKYLLESAEVAAQQVMQQACNEGNDNSHHQ